MNLTRSLSVTETVRNEAVAEYREIRGDKRVNRATHGFAIQKSPTRFVEGNVPCGRQIVDSLTVGVFLYFA